MSRQTARAVSIFLFTILAGSLALSLGGELGWANEGKKFSKRAKAASEKKKELIHEELESLKAHPWAGHYFFGDGLGVNVDLSLAPKSGFVFTWHGCVGLYDLNYGDVVEADGKIRLLFKYPNDREGFQGIAPELIPIVWGERHYLIPADEVVRFANAINAGFEPRATVSRRFLLREGDELKTVNGKPNLAEEYSGYLLDQPIRAEVTSIKDSRLEKDTRITTLMINAGSAQGVKQGMEFYVYSPESVFEWAQITKVDGSSSEARVRQDVTDEKYGRPSMDWKLSTSARRE